MTVPNILIFGSTRFAPLSDIPAFLADHADDTIWTWGTNDVAREVHRVRPDALILTASSNRNDIVSRSNTEQLTAYAFVARDPETREISEGTNGLITVLQKSRIQVEIVGSSLTAPQADAYHDVEWSYRKLATAASKRSRYHINRLTAPVARLDAICVDLEAALASDETNDDDRWIRSLRRVETMRKLLHAVEAEIASRPLVQAVAA